MGLDLGFLDLLGGISNIIGAAGARQQAIERGQTQLQGGYREVGTAGGEVPAGGFRLSEDVQNWISERNEGAGQGGGLLGFLQGTSERGAQTGNIRTVDEANDLVRSIRRTDPALADQLAGELNEQLGGTPIHLGAQDIKGALETDFTEQTEAAEEDWQRQLEGLDIMREGLTADVDAARRHVLEGTERLMDEAERGEQAAVQSLDMAKVGTMMQLADSMRLRREVMSNFQDNTARSMEMVRGALNSRHRNDENALRNRLANDPAFANRPDLVEFQVGALRHAQRTEVVDAAAGMKVQYDNQRAALDMSSAQLEAQAATAAAGQAVNISQLESGMRTHFSDSRATAEANRTQVNVTLDLLERENKTQLADYLRNMTRTVVPHAPVLQMAMGLDIAIEDRANALKWGSAAEANAFWGNLGGTLMGLGAVERQNEQIEAQQEAQRSATEMGWAGIGIQALGAVTGSGGLAGLAKK